MKNVVTFLFVVFSTLLGASSYAETWSVQEAAAEKQALIDWVEDNSHTSVDVVKSGQIVETALAVAADKEVDVKLILSVMQIESNFQEKARSSYGAQGLMQVVPRWHRDKLQGRSAFNPKVSIEVGTQVLKDCWDRADGNLYKALGCYSGGGGQKYYKKVVKQHTAVTRAAQESIFDRFLKRF